jgi:hypothetical protein
LQALPLTKIERRWLECVLTSPESELAAVESFERFGEWVMPFRVGNVLNDLRMRPAALVDVRTGEEVQLSPDGRATLPGR